MKKVVFIVVLLCIIACSSILAVVYDPKEDVRLNSNLPFDDLIFPALDRWGSQKRDNETGEALYNYHRYINEILKANSITIDRKNNKLIEGYENHDDNGKSLGTYSFKPDDSVTKGEFIKMAISLSNNRSFDYSIFPIPESLSRHWAAPYVVVAQMQGVIEEGDINIYNIDEPINRIDVIKILSKIQINMKGIPQHRDGILPNYTDISMLSEQDKEYLLHAAKYDLIEGMFEKDGTELKIYPYDNITRAAAARAILRVY